MNNSYLIHFKIDSTKKGLYSNNLLEVFYISHLTEILASMEWYQLRIILQPYDDKGFILK